MWESNDINSPVVRIPSAASHSRFSSIWRNLNIAKAQEIFQWEMIYEQTLEKILFQLSAVSRNEVFSPQSECVEVWKVQKLARDNFLSSMRRMYEEQFGAPDWIGTEDDIIGLVRTFDTCCSRADQMNPFDRKQKQKASDQSSHLQVSMKFRQEDALVRRYMRQIIIDPGHIYATAGELFMLRADLWDPHHDPHQMNQYTTFRLDPPVPWLEWQEHTQSFCGVVPEFVERTSGCDGVRRAGYYRLELNVVAATVDKFSDGVQRETTVRAKVSIWVQNSSSDSLFDTRSNEGQAFFNISRESRATEKILGSQPLGGISNRSATATVPYTGSSESNELERYEDTEYDSYILDHSFDTDLSGSEAWLVGEMDECMIPQMGNYQGLQSISRRYANEARAAAAKKPVVGKPQKVYPSVTAEVNSAIETVDIIDQTLQALTEGENSEKNCVDGMRTTRETIQEARRELHDRVISEVDRVMNTPVRSRGPENIKPSQVETPTLGMPVLHPPPNTPSVPCSPGSFVWDYSPSAWCGISWSRDYGHLQPSSNDTEPSSNESSLNLDADGYEDYETEVLGAVGTG
jgi:hypothetical protein